MEVGCVVGNAPNMMGDRSTVYLSFKIAPTPALKIGIEEVGV